MNMIKFDMSNKPPRRNERRKAREEKRKNR